MPTQGQGFDLGAWLSGVGDKAMQFAQSPQMPVLAGQLGAAAMGPNQQSWQAQVGKVGAGWGQSAIAAEAAKKQAEERKAYQDLVVKLLSGVQLTPDGQAGPTNMNVKFGPDGTYKATQDGNVMTAGNPPAGATNPGQMDPKQFQQAQAPQGVAPQGMAPINDPRLMGTRLLPF